MYKVYLHNATEIESPIFGTKKQCQKWGKDQIGFSLRTNLDVYYEVDENEEQCNNSKRLW